MAISIKAENLSKAYQLGEFSTGTISRDIERWWAKMRGKEDPFLKIGETNDRTSKGSSDIVWSLKDINFDIKQGDAVGIIGRNGAGKSTLLKVLSRVTSPSTGSVKVKGRIASLLEVGTGFHPELTGRENIFLNGAILGMRKFEIKKHFDAIVDFAGVERYIDTPVKRYSSGMYVRLAFAVAAHLESEILIVDEVLAVGDIEFQNKCLGKMGDVSKGQGRTVLFVSHNMAAIKTLCRSGILLKNGEVEYQGDVERLIQLYSSENSIEAENAHNKVIGVGDEVIKLSGVKIIPRSNSSILTVEDEFRIVIDVELTKEFCTPNLNVTFYDEMKTPIFVTISDIPVKHVGKNTFSLTVPDNFLNNGTYILAIGAATHSPQNVHFNYEVSLKIQDVHNHSLRSGYNGQMAGLIRPRLSWNII